MDKYVKLADLEKCIEIAGCVMGLTSEDNGKYLAQHILIFAQDHATDEVAKIIRCKDCARRLEHETLGNVCVKNSPTLIPVKLDGFCSDAFPTKLKI